MKRKRETLVERAAALIKEDELSGRAATTAPPRVAQETDKHVGVNRKESSDFQPPSRPDLAEKQSHLQAEGEIGGEDSEYRSRDRVKISEGKKRQSHILMPALEQSRAVEEVRQIKRSLLQRMYAKSAQPVKYPNMVLITSSRPDEGKTFIALNLAISLASEKDLSVILIDVDQTKRGVRANLGIASSTLGINDILAGESVTLADVLIDTDIDGLSIIPAGTYDPLMSELLGSAKMDNFLRELADVHRRSVVIFDAPPVLATTEAAVLAAQLGHVVFVIEAGKTSQTTVQDALEIIGHNENIGFVLNKTRSILGDSDFGSYYYSYGYGTKSVS